MAKIGWLRGFRHHEVAPERLQLLYKWIAARSSRYKTRTVESYARKPALRLYPLSGRAFLRETSPLSPAERERANLPAEAQGFSRLLDRAVASQSAGLPAKCGRVDRRHTRLYNPLAVAKPRRNQLREARPLRRAAVAPTGSLILEPLFSLIILDTDKRIGLDTSDTRNLRPRLEEGGLVVLRACENQWGGRSRGTTSSDSTRLSLAGAPTVVARLWPVTDEATKFYDFVPTHLRAGGQAESLGPRSRGAPKPEPVLLGAFVLTGDSGSASSQPVKTPE